LWFLIYWYPKIARSDRGTDRTQTLRTDISLGLEDLVARGRIGQIKSSFCASLCLTVLTRNQMGSTINSRLEPNVNALLHLSHQNKWKCNNLTVGVADKDRFITKHQLLINLEKQLRRQKIELNKLKKIRTTVESNFIKVCYVFNAHLQ
jgi:hypothetical protein